MAESKADLKTGLAEQGEEMHRLNNRTIMWICGFILGYSVFVLGVIQLFIDKP